LKFSDDCSIARGSGHITTWVWRLAEQKWSRETKEAVPTGRQPARMVWAAIWIDSDGVVGRSPLVIMKRDSSRRRAGYTARSYLKALTEGLLPNYSAGELFTRDNARIHTARISQRWLRIHRIETIDWPPCSPDLDPIEHLWCTLKQKLHELCPEFECIGDTNIEWEQFENGLREAWSAIPDFLITKLILSMPRRLAAFGTANGYQAE